jgi:hypothetical protein
MRAAWVPAALALLLALLAAPADADVGLGRPTTCSATVYVGAFPLPVGGSLTGATVCVGGATVQNGGLGASAPAPCPASDVRNLLTVPQVVRVCAVGLSACGTMLAGGCLAAP